MKLQEFLDCKHDIDCDCSMTRLYCLKCGQDANVITYTEKLKQENEKLEQKLAEATSILASFNEYREATDRKETSKSNTKWHTFERLLYDMAGMFLAKENK